MTFPIYIPSKGRADSRLTVKTLDDMGADYHVVVEPQEHDEYAAVIDPKRLLVLDMSYKDRYDTCDKLGDTRTKGSGPARNFIWDHAEKRGAAWHWIMDDNIRGFFRLNRNLKIRANSTAIFQAMEDFVQRYKNISMAGPNYAFFAKRKQKIPPFVANTKLYSCNLIRTDTPFRWRARYNEDVDLSLRMLKAGWCTVQFNAFLQGKMRTQTVKGGNQELYARGTEAKSRMLVDLHPDVAYLKLKFGRAHHHVDYRPFRGNRLLLKDDVVVPDRVNDYGMRVIEKSAARPA